MADIAKKEGDTWGAWATNSPDATQPRTVRWQSSPGTALAGIDYQEASGTLVVPPGGRAETLRHTIFDDDLYEGTETFWVSFEDGSVIDRFLINDDDDLPRLTIASSSLSLVEGAQSPTVRFELSNPSAVPIKVNVSLSPAGWESDVALRSFEIAPFQTSVDVSLATAIPDDVLEKLESGTLIFEATVEDPFDGKVSSLNFNGKNTLDVTVADQLTSNQLVASIQEGIDTSKELIDQLDVTVEILRETNPGNSDLDIISTKITIVGKTLDGADIVVTYLDNISAAGNYVKGSRAHGEAIYAAYEQAVFETIETFIFKPAVTAMAGAAVAQQAFYLGVAAGVVTGVSAASVIVPLLVVGAAGWAATVAYEELFSNPNKQTFKSVYETLLPKENFIQNYEEASGTKDVPLPDLSQGLDRNFYNTEYADVAAAGVDPVQHYANYGWLEGRDPNFIFSTKAYLYANSDVSAAGINPLEHYRVSGWQEGRDPGFFFDTAAYLAQNPDVAAAGINPLEHFIANGRSEGRNVELAVFDFHPVNGIDQGFYFAKNPDVAASGMSAADHYHQFGWREGRDPNAYFSTTAYLSINSDVASAGMDPLAHYEQFGWREGRSTGGLLDTNAYLINNPDVAAAQVNPLDHWLNYGINEGRQSGWYMVG